MSNPGTGARAGVVSARGQNADFRVEIRQDGLSCTYSVSPTTLSVAASGGASPVTVTTQAGCAWTATADDSWLSVSSGGGNGDGTVMVNVSQNSGTATRTGSLQVAGQRVSVKQNGSQCTVSVSPTSRGLGAAGGSFPVTITTSAACAWEAKSNDGWLSVSSSQGTGSSQVTVTAATNAATSARTGTLRIGGQVVSVSQDGAMRTCTYSVTPTSQTVGAGGGTLQVAVTTADAACAWTASSSASWITITSGQSGTGPGNVRYAVAANTTTSSRSATLQVAGQTVTLTQDAAAPCAYTVSPTSQSVVFGGGTFQVAVDTTSACAWTASSNAPWVTITTGQSGTGPGTVGYVVAQNTATTSRSASLQVGGQTASITQAAAPVQCSYTLNPASQTVPAAGGPFQFTISTPANTCQWTASTADSWITLGTASGSGTATVSYTVAANLASTSRSGSIQAGGQTFSISQTGVPCTFSVNPSTQNVAATGGTFQVTMTSPGGCAWTASSNASWLTVTSGSAGSGNGGVSV